MGRDATAPDDRPSSDPTVARPRTPSDWPLFLGLVGAVVWAAEITTRFVAARFGYHARLGRPAMFATYEVTRAVRWTDIGLALSLLIAVAVRRARWLTAPLAVAV